MRFSNTPCPIAIPIAIASIAGINQRHQRAEMPPSSLERIISGCPWRPGQVIHSHDVLHMAAKFCACGQTKVEQHVEGSRKPALRKTGRGKK